MILQRPDVTSAFLAAGILAGPLLSDDALQSVEDSDVFTLWQKWVYSLPRQLTDASGPTPKPKYILPAWDCHNQAASFEAFVAMENAVSGSAYSIAFGRMFYLVGGTEGHSLCWYVRADGALRIFEEQTGEVVTLSAIELPTVYAPSAA